MTIPTLPKRYEVRSLLGEGGQGRVYRVQDSIRDRELALKLVTPAESAFLRREFDTLRQIRHENLIQVFDWGTLPAGEAYYTMELIEGGDWSRRMGKPQPADEVRHVLTCLLRGLAHLHCHGEIHGDLKPENILLGAGGVVKITDTGMGGRGGSGSGMSGTPGYAAPEVWEGATANVRSDLYSVGVMAYEALTGHHPFEGHTVRQVVSEQLEGWVPSPGVHGVRVPADLERVVMRALERQPGLRQGSGDEFMEGFGVEDRIGEILGGKLVGREKEIAEIEGLLYSNQPGTPTLLCVTGEPGIGKSALIDEVSARLLGRGGRAIHLDFENPKAIEDQVRAQLGMTSPSSTSSSVSPSDLQSDLIRQAEQDPILLHAIGTIGHAEGTYLMALARYIWALSVERATGSRVIVALEVERSTEPFVKELRLTPLGIADCELVLKGTLGAARIQRELASRLSELSGGNAGLLRSSLASFIEQGVLARRDGLWKFRETASIHSLGLQSANPWVIAWKHLVPIEQRTMAILSLVNGAITTADLGRITSHERTNDVLSSLRAKGWLRDLRQAWSLASDAVRQAVQSSVDPETKREIAEAILQSGVAGEHFETIDLELSYRATLETLNRGLEWAEHAASRGDQRLAIERLRLCLGIARKTCETDAAVRISLRIASLLHQMGDEDGAETFLSSDDWPDEAAEKHHVGASRRYILGQIEAARGNLEQARDHFRRCIDLARHTSNRSLLLRCHADLAEIDWRHGDENARTKAISRMRDVLSEQTPEPDQDLRDERAGLMYQLGAATVFAGASRDAIDTLREGFALAASDYWKMRLANAICAAFHYMGDADAERQWLDEAWHYAETSQSDSFRARILSNRGAWFVHQGRFAEGAEQDRLSATWARRFGNSFEYAAGCSGAAICFIHLAKYDEALAMGREVMAAARVIDDYTYLAKAHEIEALAKYHLGRAEDAETGLRAILPTLREHGYSVVKPRLEWLLAKVLTRKGQSEEAGALLREAEVQLLETKDLEDLWGVQIEIQLRMAKNGRAESSLVEIRRLFREAEKRQLLVVALPAALAISEILHEERLDATDYRNVLVTGLEMAESSGAREVTWQLSYRMGALAARLGERKESYSRFNLASRTLRQIASELSTESRESYLSSPHVTSAIESIDAALSN